MAKGRRQKAEGRRQNLRISFLLLPYAFCLAEPYTSDVAPTSPTTWQLIGQMSTIGMSFVFALVIGFGAGYWLDGVLDTKPWLSFIGFFLGLSAGVLNVYRVLKLSNAASKDSRGSMSSTGSNG